MGSILQPNVSGMIQLSHGEAYVPHDKGNGNVTNRLDSTKSSFPSPGYSRMIPSGSFSRFLGSSPTAADNKWPQTAGM